MVSAHAHGGGGLMDAVLAGVDSIEHGTYLCEQPEVIRMMAERGTYLVPTMGFRFHPVYGNVEQAKKGLPDKESSEEALAAAEAHVKSFRMAHEAGIKIAAGTDFMRFDISPLAWEIYTYVREGGMTCMEAIVSGTKTAAEACGLRKVGTIRDGMLADLIVVDGDPLKDITVLQDAEKIRYVLKEGMVEVEDGRINW